MENYRKVQKIINSQFDDLMELKFGCEIKAKFTGGGIGCDKWEEIKIDTVVRNFKGRLYFSDIIVSIDIEEVLEILGQPVTMQNLGRTLGDGYMINLGDGALCKYSDRLRSWVFVLKLDLSKPPQEWGEEKLGEILQLIK